MSDARPVVNKYTDLLDAGTVDLPALNAPLAAALAAAGGGGSITFSMITDGATVDLPAVNGPLATALGLKADAADVSNVDNTSDADKPVSTAQQAALDLKANASAVSNVDNTSDADKPVSTAQQAALDLKANAASLATVATSGSYDDLSDQPTIPSDSQVSEYLVDDGANTITSSGGTATPDAANGRSQKLTLSEDMTLNAPTNLGDGESMLIVGTQDGTPRTVTLAAAFIVMGGGVVGDIAALGTDEKFALSIVRDGLDFLVWISTQA